MRRNILSADRGVNELKTFGIVNSYVNVCLNLSYSTTTVFNAKYF